MLTITFDTETGAIYIKLREHDKVDKTESVDPDVNLDYIADDIGELCLAGVEILTK